MTDKFKQILEFSSFIVILLALIMFAFILFSAFYPFKVSTINAPYDIDKEFYYPGDRIAYWKDACIYMPGSATVTKSFVNGLVYNMEQVTVFNPKGCVKELISSTTIPEELPPGTYHLRFRSEYRINAFRTILLEWNTKEFTVLPREENGGKE